MTRRALQTSSAPTRKLTAATLAAAIITIARVATENLAPEWSDMAMWDALLPITVFACGYIVKDNPNIQEESQ